MIVYDIKSMGQDAIHIFKAGLQAAAPDRAIRKHCRIDGTCLIVDQYRYDLDSYARIFIIGAGKATAIMAREIERLLGDRISAGCIVVKYDHTLQLNQIQQYQAGHPVPDENGVEGASEILKIVSQADAKDLIICLLSGGGSALLPLPSKGISLADKQAATEQLLSCGARIREINTLRKHLSSIKGGQLARAVAPATLLTLILSDVIGDDLEVIASGPTAPDPTTFANCFDILHHYGLTDKMPLNICNHIQLGMTSPQLETPKPGDPIFRNVRNLVIANNRAAIHGARIKAKQLGYNCLIISSMIEGEAREVARVHAAIAKEISRSGDPITVPACLISGGETTVTLKGSGKGGRNQEFALAAAVELGAEGNIVVLSAGTDGTDGPTDAAGALCDTTTVARAETNKLNPAAFLKNNDSYHFFKPLNDLIITGPTQTNVMDLQIVLVR